MSFKNKNTRYRPQIKYLVLTKNILQKTLANLIVIKKLAKVKGEKIWRRTKKAL